MPALIARKAKRLLGWQPVTDRATLLREGVETGGGVDAIAACGLAIAKSLTAASGNTSMIVAYLTSFYPHGSHSFIRREIVGVEAHGVTVERFSIRPPARLVDPADMAEAERTTVLLAAGRVAVARRDRSPRV